MLYSSQCVDCGGNLEDLADHNDVDWNKIYYEIARELLENKNILINAELHLKTAEILLNAINRVNIPNDNQSNLAQYLQQNIFAFSAAKSFTQMQYYRDMMIDDGKILSKSSFIKKIADTGEIFNKKYLDAEYENAYYSTIMAEQWDRYGDEDILQYTTVGDRRVRPSHAILDKHTAPKSDPFWKNNYPPNGWSCRCAVVPGNENNLNKLSSQEAGRHLKAENKDTTFWNNVGESKLIFRDNHPYFINSKGKETNLSWENYGMMSLNKIKTYDLPLLPESTKNEFFDWWKSQKKIINDNILVKDVTGFNITLPSHEGLRNSKPNKFFKEHIFDNNDSREKYAIEVDKLLRKPDEVWMNPKDGNVRTYIKYYADGELKLVVDKDFKAISMYKIKEGNTGELDRSRKGILLYKK